MVRAFLWAALIGGCLILATPAFAQTCAWMPKHLAEDASRFLPPGIETQYYCAPCRDRRALKNVVQEIEIRPVDTYNHQLLINGRATDLAYLYLFDPRRKSWRNLGLAIRCHEEDDVPPTLPPARVAP